MARNFVALTDLFADPPQILIALRAMFSRMVRELDLLEIALVRDLVVKVRDNGQPRCRESWIPFRFIVIAVAGWMKIINYRREENRVLREQLGGRRVRLNDDQRRRLASMAKGLGWKLLKEVATPCDAGNFIGLAPEADRQQV